MISAIYDSSINCPTPKTLVGQAKLVVGLDQSTFEIGRAMPLDHFHPSVHRTKAAVETTFAIPLLLVQTVDQMYNVTITSVLKKESESQMLSLLTVHGWHLHTVGMNKFWFVLLL